MLDARSHLVSAAVDAARGRHHPAVEAAREAIRLDPAGWRVRADLAFYLLAGGRFADALRECDAVLALDPAQTFVRDMQLTAAARMGAWAEARSAALVLMTAAGAAPGEMADVAAGDAAAGVARYRQWQLDVADREAERAAWPPMTAAAIYSAAGEVARALHWLRRAEARNDPTLILLPALRDFDPVRDDPDFRAFEVDATRPRAN